jgi:hypothetical protein
MKIKVLSIKDAGNIAKERVVIRAMDNVDLGKYAVACTEYDKDNKSFSPEFVGMVWFPDIIVAKNHFIVIYTKSGTHSSSVKENGVQTHFFYFDIDSSIWESEKNGVALLNITDWQLFDSSDIKK